MRHYLPSDYVLSSWENLKFYFEDLLNRPLDSAQQMEQWLKDRSELGSFLEEDMGWRYIRMTCDTTNEQYAKDYDFFVSQIEPHIAPYEDLLNKKWVASPFKNFRNEEGIAIALQNTEAQIEIFREENIPLQTKLQQLQQEYGRITGGMTVMHQGKELTLQQAGVMLQETDRQLRKEVWEKIQAKRKESAEELQNLFSKLIELRHQIAVNAGFANYRDYMFKAMGRFSYTPEDCKVFHAAVRDAVVPLTAKIVEARKKKLGYDSLKPYDLAVDPEGNAPLKPFDGPKDLLNKAVENFNRIHPEWGAYLQKMEKMGHLDLDSRKGKAPGGYNYPLDEVGVPFIFMNASGTVRDLVTMVHEGGHALHSFWAQGLAYNFYKHPPSEVAELASMAMELLTMEHWDVWFNNPQDLIRAKKDHLTQILETLPWVACIDAFQHWLYENPAHSVAERNAAWLKLYKDFHPSAIDWEGYEAFQEIVWQKQLHLFEVPFYYIEYGIAQLASIGVWLNTQENRAQGLAQYREALELGFTKDIAGVYATAGVKLDFSKGNIERLMGSVWQALEKLN